MSQRVLEAALWTVPIVGIAIGAIVWAWTSDDGFAYFRVVEQITSGHGVVFNRGERVETFESPIWLLVLTAGHLLSPLRLEYTAAVLSIACTTVGLVTATSASARLSRLDRATAIRLPVGLAVLAALWPIWSWATGGVEVGVSFAWIGTSFYVLMRWAGTRRPAGVPTLIVLGLGWLVRPELVFSSALFVGVVASLSTPVRRDRWRLVAIAAAVPVTYQVFRMGYYGMLVSTPTITTERFAARPERGWNYFTNFVGPYALVVPLLAILLAIGGPLVRSLISQTPRALAAAGAVTAAGLLQIIIVVVTGGGGAHAQRFLPGLFALLAPFFVVAATRRYIEGTCVALGWALVCVVWLRPTESPSDGIGTGSPGSVLTHEDRGFDERGIDQPWIDGPGLYVASTYGSTATRVALSSKDASEIVVAAGAAGAFGYALGPDARIVDVNGMTDTVFSHYDLTFEALPGDQKIASAPWLAAMLADNPSNVLPGVFPTGAWWDPEPTPLEFLSDVAWATAALECAPVRDLRERMTEPLGIDGFLRNVVESVSTTTLRIDRSPMSAFRELCGPSTPAAVESFYELADLSSTLRATSAPGELVVSGECAIVLVGTGEADNPWMAVEATEFHATVTLDPGDSVPSLTALLVASASDESVAVVWMETDGLGNYRISEEVKWFPTITGTWMPIPESEVVGVTLSPDLAASKWVITSPETLPGFPMVVTGDRQPTVVVPVPAGPSSTAGSTRVGFDEVAPSSQCAAIVDHHRRQGRE